MSSRYIPPALRKRNADDAHANQRIPEKNEFPPLASSGAKAPNLRWQSSKQFSALATEWNELADEEKMNEESRVHQEKIRESERRQAETIAQARHKYRESSYYDDEESGPPARTTTKVDGDGWETVDRAPRPKKEFSLEEIVAREEAERAEEESRKKEYSVWDTDEGWNYRDRRGHI